MHTKTPFGPDGLRSLPHRPSASVHNGGTDASVLLYVERQAVAALLCVLACDFCSISLRTAGLHLQAFGLAPAAFARVGLNAAAECDTDSTRRVR
ncbi:hypothetical protein QQF64_034862 [Cirrhinus molitorella]|uniref:Uncharacterized protein n=1 Tax=Cirrhinus molitorella TaxID=172907 RepID=A0ABR3NE78_9TELE